MDIPRLRLPARSHTPALLTSAMSGVGVVAPVGRDAQLIADRLRTAGLPALAVERLDGLGEALDAGRIGVCLITSDSVADPVAARRFRERLQAQPAWSDVPILVLVEAARPGDAHRRVLTALGDRPGVTLLQRPLPATSLVASVRLALLARQRQLDVRDLLAALEAEKATLEARVQSRTQEVRRLAADLTLAEHAERRRIAHLLHDDLQQRLYGASVSLELLARSVPEAGQALLEQAGQTVAGAAALARSLSHELAPPILRSEGIAELLQWLASHAREQYGLEVEATVQADVAVPQEDVRVLVYQILSELLFNVAKHAGVRHARLVAGALPGGVRITVEDDGSGFDATSRPSTFGLTAIRERAELVGGRLVIRSVPGEGTRATLEVPTGGPH